MQYDWGWIGTGAIITSYFRRLIESYNPEEIDEELADITTTIKDSIDNELKAPVTKCEVQLAMFVMHHENALGLDGMTALFYQFFWDIVKSDLIYLVNEFIFSSIMAQGMNDTKSYLILKKDKPTEMAQFRPINLCSVSYKIVSKNYDC